MPWTPEDATSHTRSASTDLLRRRWAHVANEARERLMAEGVPEAEADARAIRIANGVIRRV